MKKIVKLAACLGVCLAVLLGANVPAFAYSIFYASPYPEYAQNGDAMVYLLNWGGFSKLMDEDGRVLLEGGDLQFVYSATQHKPQCVVDLRFEVYGQEGNTYPRYTVHSALYGLDGALLADWQPVRYSGGMGDWVVARAGEDGWDITEEPEVWLQNLYTGEQRYRGEFDYLYDGGIGFISYYKGSESMLLMQGDGMTVQGVVDMDASLVVEGPWPLEEGYRFTCNGYLVSTMFTEQGEEYYIQSYTDENGGSRLYDIAEGYQYIYNVDGLTALQTLPYNGKPSVLRLEDTAAGQTLFEAEMDWEFAYLDWVDGQNVCLFGHNNGSRLYSLAGDVLFEGQQLVLLEHSQSKARYLGYDDDYILLLDEAGGQLARFKRGGNDGYGRLFEIADGRYGWCGYGEKMETLVLDGSLRVLARLEGTGFEASHTENGAYLSVYCYSEAYDNGYYKTYDADGRFVAYGQALGGCIFAQEGYNYTVRDLQGNLLYSENRFSTLRED